MPSPSEFKASIKKVIGLVVTLLGILGVYLSFVSYRDGATSEDVNTARREISEKIEENTRKFAAQLGEIYSIIRIRFKYPEFDRRIYGDKESHEIVGEARDQRSKDDGHLDVVVEESKICIYLHSANEQLEFNLVTKRNLISRFEASGYPVATNTEICQRSKYRFSIFARLDMPTNFTTSPKPAGILLTMVPQTAKSVELGIPHQIRASVAVVASERPDNPGVIMRAASEVVAQLAGKIPPYKP